MQIDVGFGDIVYPEPAAKELPSMLNFPKSKLLCGITEIPFEPDSHAFIIGVFSNPFRDHCVGMKR